MPDLLSRLHERKLGHWAVAYLAGAWLFLEALGFVAETFGWPGYLIRSAVFLATVGFLAVVVLAWYHGAKGQQRLQGRELLILTALLIVAAGAIALWGSPQRQVTRQPELLPIGGQDLGVYSLAVLPLANNTGADSLDWLGPGLANMLITDLEQIEELQVVSALRLLDLMRQSGREATDRIPEDLALSVAARSGARTLVYGSFVKLGDDIRLDVQLIDTSNGTVTGAEQERGPEVFTLVDAVSARLSSRVLSQTITPTELTPVSQLTTGSLDAYREYQQGLLAQNRLLYEQAESHFRRAVELDSTFAKGWLMLGFQANTTQEQIAALKKADRYKEKASERDRLLIQARLARVPGNLEKATALLEELIARYPDDKESLYQLSIWYRQDDRPEDCRQALEETLRLDPFYAAAHNMLAYTAAWAGDSTAADSFSLRYLRLEPDVPNPYDTRGEILEMFGRNEEAREMFREAIHSDPGFLVSYQHLVRSYLREDDPAGGRAELHSYRDTENPVGAVWTRILEADTYEAEGHYLDAFAAARRAVEKAGKLGRDDLRFDALMEAGFYAQWTGAYAEAEEAYQELHRLDPLNRWTFLWLIGLYSEQGRFEEMRQVRDSMAAAVETGPEFRRESDEGYLLLADGVIEWYRGDAEQTLRLVKEARTVWQRPMSEYLRTEEALALIQVGRASEVLGMLDWLEEQEGNRIFPINAHLACYLRGRAYEALGETEQAIQSYERLLEVAGDGVREAVLFRDTPERVAKLKAED